MYHTKITNSIVNTNKYHLILILYLISTIVATIGYLLSIKFSENVGDIKSMATTSNYFFGLLLFKEALIEEIIFRFLPVLIAFIFIRNLDSKIYLLVAISTSAYFGYSHGGYFNILIQGISGFVFFTIFMEKFKENGNLVSGLIESTKLHFMFNSYIFLIMTTMFFINYLKTLIWFRVFFFYKIIDLFNFVPINTFNKNQNTKELSCQKKLIL